MDTGSENIIYKVDILNEKADDVKIEIKQVEKDREPLLNCENLEQNCLLQKGRKVLQCLRELALGPEKDEHDTDDTYDERDPYSGPIKRTQLPVYPKDTQSDMCVSRYYEEATPEHEYLELETPRIVAEAVNRAMEQLPGPEIFKEGLYSAVVTLTGWLEKQRDSFLGAPMLDKQNTRDKLKED